MRQSQPPATRSASSRTTTGCCSRRRPWFDSGAREKTHEASSSRPGKGETDLHFIEYPEALNNLTLQRKLATALDAIGRDLTDAHRADLRRHALVLTAANTLELLGELWSVDPSVADSVPATQRLHRRLSEYEVLNRLCTPFNVSSWVIKTCRRLRDGDASDQERKSLYALLRGEVHISMKAWEAAKRAPFLTDHRGNAAAPVQLVSRRTPNAALLAPALQYPTSRVDERHPRFAIFDWRKSFSNSAISSNWHGWWNLAKSHRPSPRRRSPDYRACLRPARSDPCKTSRSSRQNRASSFTQRRFTRGRTVSLPRSGNERRSRSAGHTRCSRR